MTDGVLVTEYPGRIARYGHVLALDAYVTDPEIMDPAREMLRWIQPAIRKGETVAICIRVRGGSKAPPQETRDRVRRFLDANGEKLLAVAVIFEGTGFWLATFRAVLGALIHALRTKVEIKLCATVADAVAHLTSKGAFTEDDQADTLREFYAVAQPAA